MQRGALDSLLFVDWVWGYARVRDGETREVSFMAGASFLYVVSVFFVSLLWNQRHSDGMPEPKTFQRLHDSGRSPRSPSVRALSEEQLFGTSLFLLSCVVVLFAGRREIQLEE